jgi:hypothetical protein
MRAFLAKLGAAALILCVVIRFWISGLTTTLITLAVMVGFLVWISITQRRERRGLRRDGSGGDAAYVAGSSSGGHHSHHGGGDFSGGGDFGGGGDSGGGGDGGD